MANDDDAKQPPAWTPPGKKDDVYYAGLTDKTRQRHRGYTKPTHEKVNKAKGLKIVVDAQKKKRKEGE